MVEEVEITGEPVMVISSPDVSGHYHTLFIEMPILFPLPNRGFVDACPTCSYQFTVHVKDGASTPHFCLRCHHVWYECYWEERG